MKKHSIKLTESKIHKIINESVKRVLKESKDTFNEERFNQWEEKTHIPDGIKKMISIVSKQIGCPIDEEAMDETITLYNRGGYPYAYGKGFSLSHCTSSYADGPSTDYSDELVKWISGLGFEIENSYGDNGMDYTTNYQDTYWTYEFIYKPSIVYSESFMDWGDEDYEDEDYDRYDDEMY